MKRQLETRSIPSPELSFYLDPWRNLAKEAEEPNPFFGPDFLPPYMSHLTKGDATLFVLQETESGRWLAAFPVCKAKAGLIMPVARIMATDYGPYGTPLITLDTTEDELALLLDHICRATALPALLWPFLPVKGKAFARLHALPDWHLHSLVTEERAAHAAGAKGREQYRQATPTRRRREHDRLGRRLIEHGDLATTSSNNEQAIAAFETFLKLEEAGWKGGKGSALASNPETEDFSRQMIAARAKHDGVRIDALTLNGAPVAMLVLMKERGHVFAWKTAYDERYARYSPGGRLVLQSLLKNLHEPGFQEADSLAIPDHPMITPLWRGRMHYTTALLSRQSPESMRMRITRQDFRTKAHLKSLAHKLKDHLT